MTDEQVKVVEYLNQAGDVVTESGICGSGTTEARFQRLVVEVAKMIQLEAHRSRAKDARTHLLNV